MTLSISRDSDRTWDFRKDLEDGDGFCLSDDSKRSKNRELSCPSIHRTADGRIHVAYTWFRKASEHLSFDAVALRPGPTSSPGSPRARLAAPHSSQRPRAMLHPDEIARAADLLIGARSCGLRPLVLPPDLVPIDAADADAIQFATAARLGPIGGRKVFQWPPVPAASASFRRQPGCPRPPWRGFRASP